MPALFSKLAYLGFLPFAFTLLLVISVNDSTWNGI